MAPHEFHYLLRILKTVTPFFQGFRFRVRGPLIIDSRVRGIGNSYNTHLKTILYYMGHMVQPSGLGM